MASRKCATKYNDDYVMGSDLEFSSNEASDTESDDFVPPTKKASVTSKKTGVERQPTRRPDPNVSNRNALLARENRRRKKEHLENLEAQCEQLQKENRVRKLEMKRQAKLIKRLEREAKYYKNLLKNQPQIVNVLEKFTSNFNGQQYSRSSLSPASSSSLAGSSSPLSIDFNENYDISQVDYKSHDPTDYDLLGINSPFHTAAATSEYFSSTESLSEDHDYAVKTTKDELPATFTEQPENGICLHITGDKVSVEFCPTCCENAKTVEGII